MLFLPSTPRFHSHPPLLADDEWRWRRAIKCQYGRTTGTTTVDLHRSTNSRHRATTVTRNGVLYMSETGQPQMIMAQPRLTLQHSTMSMNTKVGLGQQPIQPQATGVMMTGMTPGMMLVPNCKALSLFRWLIEVCRTLIVILWSQQIWHFVNKDTTP